MEEERSIYREEVRPIMWSLADIYVNTERLLELLEDDGEEEDQEDR